MSTKNKDLLKTISDRFIKPKQEVQTVQEEPSLSSVGLPAMVPSESKIALDVVKVGRDYMVVEIEYNLDTMDAKVLSSTLIDNKVVGLAFQHGRSGLESITNRNKKQNARNKK